MAVYRFRVAFEEFDDIYRDIEIRSEQTFDHLNGAIQESIGFDNSKPASFYMSNDQWKKGQEITNHPDGTFPANARKMKESRLCDFIADPHQKIYYVFDVPSQWSFYVELFKILPDSDPGKKYPVCVKVHGEAPKQYAVVEAPKGIPDVEFMDDELFNNTVMDEEGEDIDDNDPEAENEIGFGEAVDEEEYDNIEESAEEGEEKD